MTAGLTRGDRVPDFRRLDHKGEPQLLYDLHFGQPMTLFVFDSPETPDIRLALDALGRDHPDWAQINRIAVVRGTPAQCAGLVNDESGAFAVLADDGTVTAHLLGFPPAGQRLITAFALDSNLRIIERLEYSAGGNLDAFVQQVAAVDKREAPRSGQVCRQQAPVLFIPRVLDALFCDELIALFEKDGGQPSGVSYLEGDKATWKPDPGVKIRRDLYLNEEHWINRIREMLMRRVLPEIQRCFNYQVTQHDPFKLICYDAETGGYFRPHRDNESRDTLHRRFAMTINLNTGDYTGGQLRFPEFSTDLYEPERGGAVIFSCSLLHEATNVTKGKRYALLSFFFGESENVQPVQYQNAPAGR